MIEITVFIYPYRFSDLNNKMKITTFLKFIVTISPDMYNVRIVGFIRVTFLNYNGVNGTV